MLELIQVTKRYGDKTAVKDVSFRTRKGEILGFLGRNGAGKTTTMNILTGYISASSGTVLLDGYDILKQPLEVKRRIGYLPEQPPLYMEMTVEEYLRFSCAIKGVNRRQWKRHLEDICELVRITDVRRRLIRNLSKGYRQRVGLAQALVASPEVLIFDEPTVGLDPRQIIEIRKLIKQLGENHTVILSSHILHEVADVCERLIIINKGEIVAQDTLSNLIKGSTEGNARMVLRVAGQEREIKNVLSGLHGVRYLEAIGTMEPQTVDFILETDPHTDVRKPLFDALSQARLPLMMLKPGDATLEDIFLQLTTEENVRGAAVQG